MPEHVSELHVFHVAQTVDHNAREPLALGMRLDTGTAQNPFFGFYEGERRYPVTENGKTVQVKAIRFLKAVHSGQVQTTNLPRIALETAQHYVMLARELIMEEVRTETVPEAPSRKTCLWASETLEQARQWRTRLNQGYKIFRLQLDGTIHRADAAHLLGDSEPLSVTYDRARQYWRGEMSENPEPELLFAGQATVVAQEE